MELCGFIFFYRIELLLSIIQPLLQAAGIVPEVEHEMDMADHAL
jgi:hypothetical protein